jgi:two-component system sensor histidine kinase/response regulator
MVKILVIEDEESIRENILDLLDAEDFEAFGAENGKKGVQLAIEKEPDLVLCDVMMPEIDGYSVIKALRSNPTTATIPFIFLTARVDKSDLRTGMELGADDYLTKPCTPDELLKAVRIRLEKQAIIKQQQTQKLEELRTNLALSLPHELRTPLNGILGFSELLLDDFESLPPEEVREMLDSINVSGKRLYRLIQNFLLYAELELLHLDNTRLQAYYDANSYSIKELLTELAKEQARQAERETDLHLEIENASVQVSPSRLQKLVEEIINNAFKFSFPGTPVQVIGKVEPQGYVLTISDQGRGMTPEQITGIGAYMQFERRLYEQQGSGLGLTIAKRLTEIYKGKLTIESIPEEKTTVCVTLPLETHS